MNKKIYILMATYNGEKYIKEQIDSILNQTHKNWKLIIHDDNSSDETINIIYKYVKKYPDRIKLIDDDISTGGAKENFTYLLNNIDENFDYIMFSDQDDVWLKDKIEVTLNKMIETEKKYKNKPLLVHTDLKVVDEHLNIISESMFEYQKLNIDYQNNLDKISLENIVTGCTMMLNKRLVLAVKNIPNVAIMHDWWIAIITLKINGIVEFVHNPTILYRQHESNTIGSKKVTALYYIKKILDMRYTINAYKNIYKQFKYAGININLLKYFLLKTYMIYKKIIK